MAHFQCQHACKTFQCFYQNWSGYLHFCDQESSNNKLLKDRHGLINSELHADQKYIYFIRSLKLPFECCIHWHEKNKLSMPPILLWWVYKKLNYLQLPLYMKLYFYSKIWLVNETIKQGSYYRRCLRKEYMAERPQGQAQ